MSSVVHTWQSWRHVLQPRTPWHQPPVKHLIVPCVAQEHNHTCSSGSSKHGKPTSSPLHVLGFHGADPWVNTGEKHQTTLIDIISMKLGQYKRHHVIPIHLFFSFYHFDEGHVYRFHSKKIHPKVPWWPPTPRFRAPWVATSKRVGIDTRQQPGSGCKAPKAWKVSKVQKPRDFFGENQYQKLSHQPLCHTKKKIYIYIYVAPTVLICVFFLVIFFGGGSIDSQKRTSPRFRLGFWYLRGHLNSLHLTLHHIQRPCDKPTSAASKVSYTTPPPRGWLTCPTLVYP